MSYGKIVLDLKPCADNPRNSEGAFYNLPNGHMMFAYSKFVGTSGRDDGYACIAKIMSYDGGDTWQDDEIIFRASDYNAKNIMGVSFLPMMNGDIGLFHGIRYGFNDARKHLRRSSDLGKTWSAPITCIPTIGYFVTNNDRIVRLSNNRILLPANYHRLRGLDPIEWSSFDARGIPCLFYSDDDGHTWQESQNYSFISLPHSRSGLQESGVLELKNGVIWQWMRTDVGCQYESFSYDFGVTWTVPVPAKFSSPCSPLSVKRLPGSDKLVAVWNPIPNYNGREIMKPSGGRTPLVLATSLDEGKTWSEPITVEDAPDHGYCYTAIHFTADAVLLAYCAGGPEEGSCLARLAVRKIPLDLLP